MPLPIRITRLRRGDRERLEQLIRTRTTPQRVVERARIVLASAEGISGNVIAEKLGVSRPTVSRWLDRYDQAGYAGLIADRPRPGRPKEHGPAFEAEVIRRTLETKPPADVATHWSTRLMADEFGVNQTTIWRIWRANGIRPHRIERFKRPLFHDDPDKRSPLAFLIVKSMLLTGFDAPVEQVMYLDRHIKEAELLQAIARTNRPYPKKNAGLIVDYYGVGRHLKEALAAYSQKDIEGALQRLKDEIPKLRDRYQRVLDLFRQRGVEDVAREEEACVDLLRDDHGSELRSHSTVLRKPSSNVVLGVQPSSRRIRRGLATHVVVSQRRSGIEPHSGSTSMSRNRFAI